MFLTKDDGCVLGVLGVLTSLLLRACTTLHPYSGQNKPPMYGDYEAQRHWMEITVNLPVSEWYHNTSRNDLNYWGLDYPPLTAYHSYLNGLIAAYVNPDYVELEKSRGYESEAHKLFMRYTVMAVDVFVYIPAVVFYFFSTRNLHNKQSEGKIKRKANSKLKREEGIPLIYLVVLSLFYPGIILIDHGHFQYNCVSLGLAIFAITFISLRCHLLASVAFCLALNYKQMELYHAFPFFLYLLSTCVPKPGTTCFAALGRLLKIAAVVGATFVLTWLPFVFSFENLTQVVRRLFPISRGVFEDKVGNIWCALNVVYKFKMKYDNSEMFRICGAVTLAALLPSSIDLFVRPSVKKFLPALINSSLAFFLFSFQVHEKTILLAAIPVMLYLPKHPVACFWFLCVSSFSMYPLFLKDGLTIAFVALNVFYVTSFKAIYDYSFKDAINDNTFYMYYRNVANIMAKKNYAALWSVTRKHFVRNRDFLGNLLVYTLLVASLGGCLLLVIATHALKPSREYPDLFPLLISVYSCAHFLGFFAFFNAVQFQIPQDFDKIKTS